MNHKKRIKSLIKKTPDYDYQNQVLRKHGGFIHQYCADRMEQALYNYERNHSSSGPHHVQTRNGRGHDSLD